MNDLFSQSDNYNAGFRLEYLEVFNWGTFNDVIWRISPNGYNALLTGDIGSGKSTLVDALTCLLVPHNKIVFNKAAGAEGKERNLLSYVRGEFKKEKEEITKVAKKVYLRPADDTYTVIIGNFRNEGYGENVCLAQFFWIGKDNKVEKLLLISTKPLSFKQHFSDFTDISDLKKKLRNIEGVQLYNDNFSQYSENFRRLFGMNSEKAIDLFYQTVSMKSVSSLTDFVRDQMLERTDIKEQITILLNRFEDLKKAHEAVVNAREQFQILKPLVESCVEFGKVTREIENIDAMLGIAPYWFAEKKWHFLKQAIEQIAQELNKLNQKQQQNIEELDRLERRKQSILLDIENNGGKRIEQIGEEIKRQEEEKIRKQADYTDYERLVKKTGLKQVENEKDFEDNILTGIQLIEECNQLDREYRIERDNRVSELRKIETDYKQSLSELQSLRERKTKIPSWLVEFRIQLCQDLRIEETELPFIGELIRVNEEEKEWEGAVEKLLRDAGISMLVPAQHYQSVRQYVNKNSLKSGDGRGIKLTYLEAEIHQSYQNSRLPEDDSIVLKIEIKPDTEFYDWLENYLHRSFGDYICTDVNSLTTLSYGITKQGLIKSGRIRHIKDDRKRIDDRRNYVLGWTNTEKIKLLEADLENLIIELELLKTTIQTIEKKEKENLSKKQLIDHLLTIKDFYRINWQFHTNKIAALELERNQLLSSNDLLTQLEKNKSEVESQIRNTKEYEQKITEGIGGLKTKAGIYEEQLQLTELLKNQVTETSRTTWYPVLEEKLKETPLTLKNIDSRLEEFRKQYNGDNGELRKLRGKQVGHRSAIERKMREIKDHSKAEYSEIPESIDAIPEYIKKFEQLNREDLKRHEDRFKEQLNTNVINSIAVFDNQLHKHENDIKQKIRTINQHLSDIVYNATQDTYIILQMDATPNKEVRLFKEEIKKCYTHSFSSNNELYTEEKYEQVKRILDRFASMENSDKEWTNAVTDVRQWFEFNASERFRADNTEKEFYEGSGGKSGGQKEKLAYTILASALAYQFGLQFGERKSRSFRFVVIDEAFGRGSDESTRYGLELFKKLDLQLLIVTPLQKIHVIENHVNSFHFVSNREGNNSQVSNLTKEEYEVRKLQHHTVKQTIEN